MHIVDAHYRLASLPERAVAASFGFVPYPVEKQVMLTEAVSSLYALVSDPVLPGAEDTEAWKRRCTQAMRLFGSVSSQGDNAWFVNSAMLGHPAPELAGRMIGSLNAIWKTIKGRKPVALVNAVDAFNADFGFEMLDSYLNVAQRGERPVEENEWAYIAWSPSRDDILHIGVTAENPAAVAKKMNASLATSRPAGILAAWLVYDVEAVRQGIAANLRGYRMAEGQYYVRPGEAKEVVEAVIKKTGNFVLSPWHAEGEPRIAPAHAKGL
jgi:hypothetical protein